MAVCSLPQRLDLPVGETATDITAIKNTSFILSDVGNVYSFGNNTADGVKSTTLVRINFQDSEMKEERALRKIHASKDALFGSVIEDMFLPLCNLKALEKLFLRKMKEILNQVIVPIHLLRKSPISKETNTRESMESLVKSAENVIKIVSQNVKASWELSILDSNVEKLPLIKNTNFFADAMENYTKAVCNCLVGNTISLEHGSKISQAVMDILQKICHIEQKEESRDMLKFLLLDPTSQLNHYISCLQSMILAGRKNESVYLTSILNSIEKTLTILKSAQKSIERERKSLDRTREFFEIAGSKLVTLKHPKRRVVLNSKECQITVANSASFSKHWIILMNDILVHAGYSSYVTHPLQTIWVESHQVLSPSDKEKDSNKTSPDSKDLQITLVLPEDTLVLVSQDYESKNEWLVQLQRTICSHLSINNNHTPPITRNTNYNFTKISDLKSAEYNGMWLYSKMHGRGTLTWPDGRNYVGQFRQNQKHGMGRMEIPDSNGGKTIYEGQWSDDKFEGRGKICFANGDIYRGTVKDGKPHGHGMMKQGKFMGSGASVYNGEFQFGQKCGWRDGIVICVSMVMDLVCAVSVWV